MVVATVDEIKGDFVYFIVTHLSLTLGQDGSSSWEGLRILEGY